MTDTQVGSKDASSTAPGRLVLLRHGQTVWSESGQHTGRTNIPLTDTGCEQARSAGERLREAFPNGFDQGCMFASPCVAPSRPRNWLVMAISKCLTRLRNGITAVPKGVHARR